MKPTSDRQKVEQLRDVLAGLDAQIDKVVVGQKPVINQLLVALLCAGHALIVGVPGLAKTLLVNTIASALDLTFNRIQFTPDLMPTDITGTDVIEEDRSTGERKFRFLAGPIFSHVVLADEINRAPPKTQAALLQAMQEYKVTYGGVTRELPRPFFVLATQNPIEQEGTYPLPEAQLDRFMFSITIDYPGLDDEIAVVKRTTSAYDCQVRTCLNAAQLGELQQLIRRVPVGDDIVRAAVLLVRSTRPRDPEATVWARKYVAWGAGPRASQYLILGAKAHAVMMGRFAPNQDDLASVVGPVLRHRIITNFTAEAEGVRSDDLIIDCLKSLH